MTINCKGQLIDLSTPKVMGVINLTPDSFYDGGKFKNEADIVTQVEKMLVDGATFVDLGGYSSKPGAEFVSEDKELRRVIPVVELIVNKFPEIILSVDTFRSKVAIESVASGAAMINDISAGFLDADMIKTVAKLKVPYIMMHMRGTPQTMQQLSQYEDLLKEINWYFSERLQQTKNEKIIDVILDPGFGFAKTTAQNYELLDKLELLKMAEKPILVGLSRKSMIYKTLNITPQQALNGTTALNMMALSKGANILRVHDVKEAIECVTLYNQLLNR